ncbi:MAG: EscU/YscU/HrcU family type III secretion system export apparatus switch protein [Cellulosilyticaceae bacterium]
MEDKMKKVVALSYENGMEAPQVVASGKGYVADHILEEAKKHDIPVYEDAKLATLLTEIEVGAQIPEALYDVVAEILVFVSDMDELYGKIGSKAK